MMRLLIEEKNAIKVFVEVGEGGHDIRFALADAHAHAVGHAARGSMSMTRPAT
jgi:hypothetical protein